MISVIICRPGGPATWEIDTWLMSCRVLGRGVEAMVLREIIAQARAKAIDTLVGVYRPTARNEMVAGHYAKLGFAAAGAEPDGTTHWRLSTDAASAPTPVPMQVRRLGAVAAAGDLAA